MTQTLYPLRFHPILKERIWGGQKLQTVLNKDLNGCTLCGESWEISGLEGDISIVSNGSLAGKSLTELLEIYGEGVVGKKVYTHFGNQFPLLIKFLDAAEDLSVQVHPNDELAVKRHNCWGKTEMWYVLQTDEGAQITAGFREKMSRETYLEKLENKSLMEALHTVVTKPGDVFYIPSGRVHSIGKGVLLAEIQQTSDITYRIFDYNRKDKNGNTRELHTDFALNAINFSAKKGQKQIEQPELNKSNKLLECDYFTSNLLALDSVVDKNISELDSFVIYICVEGIVELAYLGAKEVLTKGDTILIPASLSCYTLKPQTELVKLLEVYV